jgi:hypothetical protein
MLVTCGVIYVKNQSKIVTIGGTIRNAGDGWHLLDNNGHNPLNITGVNTTDEAVVIFYDTYEKVISFSVTPDETMTSEGFTVGASVGFDRAVISIYDKDHQLINPMDYINGSGNIWISGMFED